MCTLCVNCPEEIAKMCCKHYGPGGGPDCAPKMKESAPSASTNTASLQIAAKEAVDCWKVANKVDFVDFAIRMNRLEAALQLQA